MRKIFKGSLIISMVVLILSSCATTKPETVQVAPPVTPAPAPKAQPKIIQVSSWKLLTETTKYPDGTVSSETRYQYDGTGNLLKEEQFDGTQKPTGAKVYVSTSANIVEVTTTNATGDVLGKAKREYSGDRLMQETLYDPKGTLQSTEVYTYSAEGQKTRWTVTTASGNQITSEYVWDQGHIVRINVLDASGKLIKHFERTYSADGLLDAEAEYSQDGTLASRIVYVYNGKFLVREENRSPTDAVLSSIQYENSAQGNPVVITRLDRNNRPVEVKNQSWQVFTRSVQEN
jgi:antitoxin component YwqK of YwqJK toxin-antitoxin module